MTAPRMDPATGLLPGQAWNVAPSDAWQARIGRDGRAHCIGRTLALHLEYAGMYFSGNGTVDSVPGYHDFDTAMAAARSFNAAKRNAAQAGQGGE